MGSITMTSVSGMLSGSPLGAAVPLQPALIELPPIATPDEDEGASLQERFEAFHAANPAVYEELRSMALTMQARGFRKWSIKAAWESLRYRLAVQGDKASAYKLNNDYHALFAREIMRNTPQLAGFFVTRELLAD